ncbi:MAG TPA: HlyD family efflux transporter periplasmic adaptor subunit [Candidatus Solibacter sp.]|nr:HlyD family efflux transporter periplasmic adaptor subunit [Candidatus Solibacter sp.]
MDIVRPESVLKNKRRKRMIFFAVLVIAVAALTMGVYRLKPALPNVDAGNVWPDTVKRGSMLRQVHGLGTLVPVDIRWIPAQTDATVERILIWPGTLVKADSVIMELSNSQVQQEAQDADLQLKSAEADFQNTKVKVEGDLLTLKAEAATVQSAYEDAQTQADANKELVKIGVLSNQALQSSIGKAREMATRNKIELDRIEMNTRVIKTQLAVQQAKIDQMRALVDLKRKHLEALKLRAGIDGMLQELPVKVGQRFTAGTTLAKVAEPTHLKAELKIPETQAKDITIGQYSEIDTHNGIIKGAVMRKDPSVQNGTVTVDVRLEGQLPAGAVPDLSVDGTVTLETLNDVLFVGRPAFGQEKSKVGMFKYDPDGKTATRVQVELGRSSVQTVEIIRGLKEGDRVILSDMSRYDNFDRVRLE